MNSTESEFKDWQWVELVEENDNIPRVLGRVNGWGHSANITGIKLLTNAVFSKISIKNRLCSPLINRKKLQESQVLCGYNSGKDEKFILVSVIFISLLKTS